MKRQLKFAVLLSCTLCFSASYAWKTVTLNKVSSLGAVAAEYRPVGVKQMDMVIAIRDANPHVFANLANFKPGVKLLIPTNAIEVRSAIKGKYPSVAVTPAVSKAAAVTTTQKVTAPVKASPVAATVAAKPVASANANLNKHAEKTVSVTSSSSAVHGATSANVSAETVAPAIASKKALSVKTTSAPSVMIAPGVGSSAPQTLDLVNSSSIKTLQATIVSQSQAIQTYQSQITDLNTQLGAANQQMQILQSGLARAKIWSFANLGWVLWALTLFAFLLQSRKLKQMQPSQVAESDDEGETIHEEALEYEPSFQELDTAPIEPQLTKSKASKAKVNHDGPNWEQVELDIPVVESTTTQEFLGAEVEVDQYQDKALAGEQQDIINALENDQDNLDWHKALLEFYIKTNSHNGFKRHYEMMMQTGLMREGDRLWEEVRKMYLNSWVYPGFST